MDDTVDLVQEAIDALDGLALDDIQEDPFAGSDFEERSAALERRANEAGCSDEELAELFGDRLPRLGASDTNPAGQFLVEILRNSDSIDFSDLNG